MDCQKRQAEIYLYLDGQLPAERTADLLQHIEYCEECQEFLAKATALEELLHDVGSLVEPPAGFAASVMAALPPVSVTTSESDIATAKVIPFRKRFPWAARLGTAAAAAAIVIGVAVANPFSDGQVVQPLPVTPENPNISVGEVTPPLTESEMPVPGDSNETSHNGDTMTPSNENQSIEVAPSDGTTTQQSLDTPEQQPFVTNQPSESDTSTQQPTEIPPTQENNTTEDTTRNEPGVSGEISLPKAAYGTVGIGRFETRLIAAHEGVDVLSPMVNAKTNIANYYVEVDGKIQLWQVNIDDCSEPTFVAAFDNMADVQSSAEVASATKIPAALSEEESFSAFSPDGSMVATTITGEEEPGLWLASISNTDEPQRLFDKQCGKILSWAPNSGKIVFTDHQGCLYVGYPAEDLVFPVATGTVSQVIWLDRGNTIVFVMTPEGSNHCGLYMAQLP